MRILVICGSARAADWCMREMLTANNIVLSTVRRTITDERDDKSMLRFAVVNHHNDFERLRGVRYDVVIFDDSYKHVAGHEYFRALLLAG